MDLLIAWLVLLIFTLAHIISKWSTHNVEHGRVTFMHYIREQAPAKTPLAALTSIGLGLVMMDMGSFNAVTALTAGWSSNSLMEHLAKHGQNMIGKL